MSVLAKPLEKHINKHLLLHLDKYNLFHPSQSGFRKKHSCQTALTSLVEQWLSNINNLSTLMYGIPQSSVLGPILYFHFISMTYRYCIKALCELFADDTSLRDHHTDLNTLHASLQNSLDNLTDWTEMNHMALHPDKTKFMLITTRQKRQNSVLFPPSDRTRQHHRRGTET